MKDTKKTLLTVKDKYGDCCLNDSSLSSKAIKKDRKPEGWVEIYDNLPDGSKALITKQNLVLYQGRECIGQRMVDTNNASAVTTQNEYICWFGMGSGGTSIGDPLTPLSVSSLNTALSNAVPIHDNDNDASTTYTDRQDGTPGAYYKRKFDNIDFNQDPSNNKYLITKITMVVDNDDCNDTTVVNSRYNNYLNEAGLFVCSTNQGGSGQTGPWNLFSRVTFPTIVKDVSRQLTIVWYLYF